MLVSKIENGNIYLPHTKINLAGPSGIGKTTFAKWISEELDIPFVSGSYSDLIPSTAIQTHESMISKDPSEIYAQDTQIVNLRNRLFGSHPDMVSDRSYLDSASYHINKLSHHVKECDTDSFIDICKSLTLVTISHLIVFSLSRSCMKKWEMEDNNKRVLNRFYQREISLLNLDQLFLWGFNVGAVDNDDRDMSSNYWGSILLSHGDQTFYTHVLVLETIDMDKRKSLIREWFDKTGINI